MFIVVVFNWKRGWETSKKEEESIYGYETFLFRYTHTHTHTTFIKSWRFLKSGENQKAKMKYICEI